MDLITPKEASEILKVKSRTISKWLKEGKLPGFKLGKGKRGEWRISRQALSMFLEERANASQRRLEDEMFTLLASESALKKDWLTTGEDEAWKDL